MNPDLYPLTIEPSVIEQWGVSDLYDDEAAPAFTAGTVHLAGETLRAASGPMAGRTLGYIKHKWGALLVGTVAAEDPDYPFPLDLKLRRTGPSALAVALDQPCLWHILAAEPQSTFNAGFRPGLDLAQAARTAGGDPGRWAEFMPEYPATPDCWLFLPPLVPLLWGAGLEILQIGPPAAPLVPWPLGQTGGGTFRAEEADPPRRLTGRALGGGAARIYDSPNLKVTLLTTALTRGVLDPALATVIWPLAGQGRLRTQGPSPATRLIAGRAVIVPAGLGAYTIESGAEVTVLVIEAA